MKFWQTLTLSPFYDAPNDGSGGGSSTDAGAAAVGAGAGSGAQSGAQGQPNGSQAGATTQPAGTQQAGSQAYTYKEDRSNWIPKHRFDEVNTQAARARELEQQLEQERQRVRALSGVEPTDPNAQRAEQVREAFFNLPGMGIFRKLAELNEEQIDSLLQVPDQVQQTQAQQMAGWQRHADEQIGYVADSIADAMGVEALDDDQKTDVRTQFTAWLKRTVNGELRSQGQSATLQRYEAGDKKLLDEFATAYSKRWVQPGQRANASRIVNRQRAVPNSGGGRTVVSSVNRPAKFNSLDERLDFAVNRAKEMGIQFGR